MHKILNVDKQFCHSFFGSKILGGTHSLGSQKELITFFGYKWNVLRSGRTNVVDSRWVWCLNIKFFVFSFCCFCFVLFYIFFLDCYDQQYGKHPLSSVTQIGQMCTPLYIVISDIHTAFCWDQWCHKRSLSFAIRLGYQITKCTRFNLFLGVTYPKIPLGERGLTAPFTGTSVHHTIGSRL